MSPDRNLNLLDYYQIVCRAKRMIIALVTGSIIITGIVSKSLPKQYETKATTLPLREETLTGGGLSLGGSKDRGGGVLDLLGTRAGPTFLDTIVVIANSRTLAEAMVDALNLTEYYGTNSKPAAVSALRGELTIKTTPHKSLDVLVESKDPQMAATIANAFVQQLEHFNKTFTITATKRQRLFIEQRLAERAKKVAEVEDELKRFENENRIRMDFQSEGGGGGGGGGIAVNDLALAAELQEKISELEVEAAALREYALPSHPGFSQVRAQIQEYRKQLDRLETERVRGAQRALRVPLSKKVHPAFEEMTDIQFKLLGLMRKVKIEESVYGMLVGMLESAKISEARDLPIIELMDSALPPAFNSKPKTRMHVLAAGVLSLVLGILLAIFLDYLNRLRRSEASAAQTQGASDSTTEGDGNGNKLPTHPLSPKETERFRG